MQIKERIGNYTFEVLQKMMIKQLCALIDWLIMFNNMPHPANHATLLWRPQSSRKTLLPDLTSIPLKNIVFGIFENFLILSKGRISTVL